MLEFIFIIWLVSRLLRPHWGYRRYYRPFFGLGWLPLGMFIGSRMRRPHYGEGPRNSHDSFCGRGPEGFGEPHSGNGWWF